MPSDLSLNAGAVVQVAPNSETMPTEWTTVLKISEFEVNRSVENEEEEFWYGEDDPDVTGGDIAGEYTFNGGLSRNDAGQNMIRTAFFQRALLWCRVVSDTTAGIGEAQKVRPTGYNFRGERNGPRYIRSGFTARGVGDVTTISGT